MLTFFVVLIFMATNFLAAAAPERREEESVGDLWIDMLIGPPLVPLFNQVARDDDIAHVDRPEQLSQLDGIIGAQKMLIFRSAKEADALLPALDGEIDILGYNLEHGPATPPEEQADPVGTVRSLRLLADEYEMALAVGPDHEFALSHGVGMAPYVDYFVLQIQRKQTEPPVVIDFVSTLVPQLREANEELQVSVQVRTEGDMGAIVELLDTLLPYVDGVSILTSPETVDVAAELLLRLRGSKLYLPVVSGANDS